jgi:hypothetical protein
MRRNILILGLFGLLADLALIPVAAEEARPVSLDPLKLDGWEAAGPTETYLGEKLYEAIDGFADYHFGFDFQEAQRRFFTQGEKKMEVFIYRFGSPAEAFGLYSVMRPRWGQPAQVGDDAVCEEGNVCAAWRGPYYLAVTTQGAVAATGEELLGAARAVAQQVGGEYKRPRLPEMLPKENLEPLSVLYFHCLQPLDRVFYLGEGNVLQLAEKPTDPHDVQAVYAEYNQNGRTVIVIAALYPSPEKAQKARDLYVAQLTADAGATMDAWGAGTEARPYGRDFKARTGLHTLLFQREKWLLIAVDVVDVDAMKATLTKVDEALWKQWEEERKKEAEKKAPGK